MEASIELQTAVEHQMLEHGSFFVGNAYSPLSYAVRVVGAPPRFERCCRPLHLPACTPCHHPAQLATARKAECPTCLAAACAGAHRRGWQGGTACTRPRTLSSTMRTLPSQPATSSPTRRSGGSVISSQPLGGRERGCCGAAAGLGPLCAPQQACLSFAVLAFY